MLKQCQNFILIMFIEQCKRIFTGTLVKWDTTSKLTMMSPGFVCSDFSISMKLMEFLT
jgi:hypothetical protein